MGSDSGRAEAIGGTWDPAIWRRALGWIGILVSAYLGGMLIYAALLKAADPTLFVQQVQGYQILPQLAGVAAYAFLWIEFLLGIALIVRPAPRWALLGFAGLMLLFIVVTAYAWSRGNTEDCGCFGRMASRSPKEVILEDLIFLALAGFAWVTSPWVSRSRPRWIAAAAAAPLLLAMPWIAPRLPVDSLVTGVKPGFDLETMAADDLKVPLGAGTIFVALVGPDCRACVDALPAMSELARLDGAPRMTAIFSGDARQKRAWQLENVPAFPLAHASPKALRQYYRQLPVFLLLEEGKVRRVWWNRMPPAAEVMRAVPETR